MISLLLPASRRLPATEFLPAGPASVMHLEQLIDGVQPLAPTLLQDIASRIALAHPPQLFILEDVTGAGKTEAPLLLAQRLMAAGLGEGIYFGLPTMATANAMCSRLGPNGNRQLFRPESRPSLVLAHSASYLSEDFRESIVPAAKSSDGDYNGEPAAAAHCSQWLSDNRKKALLADVGIGTLDQALLAILPSRHQSLRLLRLLNRYC